MLSGVAAILPVLLFVAIAWGAIWLVRRRKHGLVAMRGTSVGADLGTMNDSPRVRVRAVTSLGADRVHVILSPETNTGESDMDLVVSMNEDEFGFGLLQQWCESQSPLAMVVPPESTLVRLRSVDDLQPITLRRLDQG